MAVHSSRVPEIALHLGGEVSDMLFKVDLIVRRNDESPQQRIAFALPATSERYHVHLFMVRIETDTYFVLFLRVLAGEIACALFPGLSALAVVGNFHDAASAVDLEPALYGTRPSAAARVGRPGLTLNGCTSTREAFEPRLSGSSETARIELRNSGAERFA